jgi:hypothetical protein
MLDGSASGLSGFRNRIINGDMRIAQRGTAAVTANAEFPVDRFNVFISSDTAGFSAQQDSSAPSGFSNSTKITITATDSFTGTENLSFSQRIEGYNIADLAWGTASAQPVTVSFWARSSVIGTHGGAIRNSAGNRSYPFSYTISSADTWEYKTIVVDGETSGSWGNSNDFGLMLRFCLGAGSDRLGTAGVWAGSSLFGATGQVNLAATNGATLYITGVQLEKGTVATPFERRAIGLEDMLCRRYFLRIFGSERMVGRPGIVGAGNNSNRVGLDLNIPMRAAPTLTFSSGLRIWDGSTVPLVGAASLVFRSDAFGFDIDFTGGCLTGLVVGRSAFFYFDSELQSISLTAEL